MLIKIKSWWNNLKYYDKVFFITFIPAMLFTFWGMGDLYINYFNELTKQDHMQFFLRISFPVSLGLLITALERKKKQKLMKGIKDYLDK